MNAIQPHHAFRLLSAAVLIALFTTSYVIQGSGAATAKDARPKADTVVVAGELRSPESVLHDTTDDVYLVSNVNGQPAAMDENGFISRVAPEGEITALRWIDGQQANVTLNAPKGMALRGDTLFVADINTVRLFDRTTGEAVGAWDVTGATFLNDLSVGADGDLYATDTGVEFTQGGMQQADTDAVYRFSADGTAEAIAQGAQLNGPNGIVATQDGPIVVTFGANEAYRINSRGERQMVAQLPEGQLDGVIQRDDGTLFISSWGGQAIYRVDPIGTEEATPVVENVSSPADIGYDAERERLLIPQLQENRLQIVPMQQEVQRVRRDNPSRMEDTTQAGAVGQESPEQESPEQEDETVRENESTAQEADMEETVSDDSSIEDDVTSAPDTVHIQVARHAEWGPYLTDAGGRALYLFKADTSRSSTCYEQCAEVWPPVLTQAAPHAADPTVQERLLGTVQRRDGRMQVTYNDWPLYYYAKDTGADQTKGQDVMGFGAEWYLVAPAGHEVHAEAEGEK